MGIGAVMQPHISIRETSAVNPLAPPIRVALDQAIAGECKLDPAVFAIPGLSGKKYRIFINNLIGLLAEPRYLEIGVLAGSTLCAAIYDNTVSALAIDNWVEFGGPADQFFANLAKFKSREARVSFLERDFRMVDFRTIGKFNVYLFDGPHEPADQRDALVLAMPALDEQFVLIVDDWNWSWVRNGTYQGIQDAGIEVDFLAEIRTTLDDSHPAWCGAESDWHNGYLVAACSKGQCNAVVLPKFVEGP